ncbi:hypothetical protein [Streptomyces sp. NPDC048392]|uniref:hypothetical protein n=1 Tax=Streptomyces sp. NPDC048392 TaxID=3365543 RepID=UPI003712EDFB
MSESAFVAAPVEKIVPRLAARRITPEAEAAISARVDELNADIVKLLHGCE